MPNPTSYSWNTVGDIVAPTIANVQVIDAFRIRVIYSEAVQPTEALVPGNYVFDNGLVAQSVSIESSNQFVVTTTQQTSGTTYLLTVSNVKDTNGNTI
jgi:hypothetical protein